MSSAGGGVTSNAPQRYFCYECNRTVSIAPSSDLVCPNCNGGFVEEVENPNPNAPHPLSFTYEFGGDDLPTLFGGRSPPFGDADAFNPLVFLQNYIQTLRAGGANVQFVIDNSGDPSGAFRLPTNLNLGDYFFGPGLEQLIQHLAENDPNRVRCVKTRSSSGNWRNRCPVNTFIIPIASYLGWNCTILVPCVDMSYQLTILIMSKGLEGLAAYLQLVILLVIQTPRSHPGSGGLGFLCPGPLGSFLPLPRQAITTVTIVGNQIKILSQKPGKKILIESHQCFICMKNVSNLQHCLIEIS
ncbi:hypothetical protein VNO77_00002 [Canavalia gladiata]|uniref:RING-type E3 ubiquitin transferase n=1 Tax=Canavalia gladiata TaxID=3824 RepID=A0AAN9MPA2_CANGL